MCLPWLASTLSLPAVDCFGFTDAEIRSFKTGGKPSYRKSVLFGVEDLDFHGDCFPLWEDCIFCLRMRHRELGAQHSPLRK